MIRWLVATIWRWRIKRRKRDEQWMAEWVAMFPGRCMYCSYTRWAWEQGARLVIGPHNCIEGNGGPRSLPVAKVRN